MILAKLRQALMCLRAGQVTMDYPAAPVRAPEGFRGPPEIDVERCVGCGACAAACPARLIRITDLDQDTRRMTRLFERCIRCGRCEEVCNEQAIKVARDFETATDEGRHDLVHVSDIYMGTCRRCGRCNEPRTPLDKIMEPGMRDDKIVRGGDREYRGECDVENNDTSDCDCELETAETPR